MKQTPLLWEQFRDRSILLFWALTSRSEETMTVLWWGVNCSTWCCFPLSPGIQHQQQSSCPQEALTYPLLPPPQSPSRLTVHPHLSLWSLWLQLPTAIHLWHIKTAKYTFTVNYSCSQCCQIASQYQSKVSQKWYYFPSRGGGQQCCSCWGLTSVNRLRGNSFGSLVMPHGKLKPRLHHWH